MPPPLTAAPGSRSSGPRRDLGKIDSAGSRARERRKRGQPAIPSAAGSSRREPRSWPLAELDAAERGRCRIHSLTGRRRARGAAAVSRYRNARKLGPAHDSHVMIFRRRRAGCARGLMPDTSRATTETVSDPEGQTPLYPLTGSNRPLSAPGTRTVKASNSEDRKRRAGDVRSA